jgi:UDP-N-acetylmuramoyl-tripeptide--D-alanyl-D-alanine ligase
MISVTERPSRADVTAGPTRRVAIDADPDGIARPTSITPDELAAWAAGVLVARGTRPIVGGAVDTRVLRTGEAFFALPGERTDGHRFLEAAAIAGAGALVVTEGLPAERVAALAAVGSGAAGTPTVVRVADAGDALRAAAQAWRDRFEPLVVGITGSLAKTSTKEQVAEVLATRRVVLRSEGNLNNEIGLPLTLLRLRVEHEAAVLEMGFYTTGEIALLASIARPTVGVVTAVRGVHLSRAGSLDAIEAGKRELVEALPPEGWAILNADDERVLRMRQHTSAQVLTYGFAPGTDVGADEVRSAEADGMRFELRIAGARYPVTTPALGRHGVHNALAAAAVGFAAGLSPDDLAAGIARPAPAPHRSHLVRSGALTILDDSYNASPDAVVAALDLLATLPGRHVAILGEMLELGDASDDDHRRVGRHAASVADLLVVVGSGAAGIAAGARRAGLATAAVVTVADRDAARDALQSLVRAGDVILVKASRGAALDLLVEPLAMLGAELAARP